MNEENKEKVSKLSLAPITTLMCILSGTFLIMLVMLFSLYSKALDGVVKEKIPIEKLDLKMSDGFIGATATLIGIMVTFVIGYQILNAIQIKKDIEEFKKEISDRISTLEKSTKNDLQKSISQLETNTANKIIQCALDVEGEMRNYTDEQIDKINKTIERNQNVVIALEGKFNNNNEKIKQLGKANDLANLFTISLDFFKKNKTMGSACILVRIYGKIICFSEELKEFNRKTEAVTLQLKLLNYLINLNEALAYIVENKSNDSENEETASQLIDNITQYIADSKREESILALNQILGFLNGNISKVKFNIFEETVDTV